MKTAHVDVVVAIPCWGNLLTVAVVMGWTAGCDVCSTGGGAAGAAAAAALHFFAAAQCLLGEPWPRQAAHQSGSIFDFVVVGGGSAGATLAARLAEARAARVLLIEAGPDPPQESIIPALRDVLKASAYDWNFTSTDDGVSSQALQGGRQRQPRGLMLGGSGSSNDMVYSRGFPADYDSWADTMGPLWNWDNVLPYFKKTEFMTDKAIIDDPQLMKYHSTDGEIEVSGPEIPSHATNVFLSAFKEMGFNMVKDMTNPLTMGAGRFSHTVRRGRRESSVTALLNKATTRPNLSVMKHTLVTKILMEDNVAIGVSALKGAEELTFYAKKEVIISAGTFNTPKLLMLSGIGPKDHLQQLGIEVVTDLPVGGNLQDHTMVLLHVTAKNGTCTSLPYAGHMEMIKYLYDQTGTLAQSDTMGAYLKHSTSKAPPNVPDFAVYPSCLPANSNFYNGCMSIIGFKDEVCRTLHNVNLDMELITLSLVLLKPASRGVVQLKSADPLDAPRIYSGTFSAPEDLELFPEAMEKVLSLVNTSYFRSVNARIVEVPLEACGKLSGREYLKCKALQLASSAWHATGTAAAALDARLRVRTVARLRVVDASVAPAVPRGNTNAPVVMIAEKAADFIKEEYGLTNTLTDVNPLWWFLGPFHN